MRRHLLGWLMVGLAVALALLATLQAVTFQAGNTVELRQPVAAPPSSPTTSSVSAPPTTTGPVPVPSVTTATPRATAITSPKPEVKSSDLSGIAWVSQMLGRTVEFPMGRPMHTNANGEIVPDNLTEVQWVNDPDMGAPGNNTKRTTYVACHTSPRKAAVCNPLYDRKTSTSHVLVGDEFLVPTETTKKSGLKPLVYVVAAIKAYPKGVVAEDGNSEVWRIVPGRLVVLTCFQNPNGTRSTENFVVFAQLKK